MTALNQACQRKQSLGCADWYRVCEHDDCAVAVPVLRPATGVVLAAASPYFETLLRGWASSHQPLHMVVGEDQLQAAQQLLAFIYIGSLQPGLQQADLLQLLLLADRFDVSRAVAAARRALATLGPECFEWPTLTGVWSLPPHLFECEGDEAAALRGVAWERLLQLFGDLEEAWSTADGRAMWQQLPWRAVRWVVAEVTGHEGLVCMVVQARRASASGPCYNQSAQRLVFCRDLAQGSSVAVSYMC